jgi:hypothetical protein
MKNENVVYISDKVNRNPIERTFTHSSEIIHVFIFRVLKYK